MTGKRSARPLGCDPPLASGKWHETAPRHRNALPSEVARGGSASRALHHALRRADGPAPTDQIVRQARPQGREQNRDGNAVHIMDRHETSMPVNVARVVYNLAGALALTRRGARIVGLGDDQYRKNLDWVLNQPWLDPASVLFSSAPESDRPASHLEAPRIREQLTPTFSPMGRGRLADQGIPH